MKKFIISYRDKSGAVCKMELEAPSRSEIWPILKGKGLSVISVQEGSLKKPRNPAFIKGAIAGCVCVVIGALSILYWPKETTTPVVEEKPVKKPARVYQLEPVRVEVKDETPVQPVEVKPAIDPDARPTKVGETLNGYIKLPSGRLHKVKGVITNSVSATQFKGKYEIFSHHSENEIACLLTIQPGEGLVGTPRYNGRFKADFLKSLETPIVIDPEDSEEDKQLKRDMIETKKELKAALDRGEDIEQIMLDTRKEYQDLARYKLEIRQVFNEMKKKEGMTENDLVDLENACNKMLEEKGIAPMKLGPISRQKLMMMQQQENY